jgi:hypothetical protein
MGLLFLLAIPLAVSLALYLGLLIFAPDKPRYRITWKEFLIQIVVVSLLMTGGYFASRWQSTQDTEVWNAEVSEKKRERVSCEHSYTCNCRTYRCGKTQCTHCDTCYEHGYDVSWFVYTTADEHFVIDRINRQGTNEPPRWTAIKIGDPTARTHDFTNYIKANPWSLLNKSDETTSYSIPAYPGTVYDYHYVDRFIHEGSVSEAKEWNRELQILNGSVGVDKQVNVIIVVTNETESFSYALQNAWLGGKKNDFIIVIGSKDGHMIEWARVISWSHSELLKVEVRDALIEIGNLEKRAEILQMLKMHIMKGFIRMEMNDYKYLLAGVEPSETAMWILLVIGLVTSSGLSWYFYTEEFV